MPAVRRIAALLKRWLLGTHQGAVSAKHLDYYLDEFTFRFNRQPPGHAAFSSTDLWRRRCRLIPFITSSSLAGKW